MLRYLAAVVGTIAVLPLLGAAFIQAPRSAIHGASAADYQSWVEAAEKAGLRPDFVSVHGPANAPQFAALAVADKSPWVARHDLTGAQYQAEFDKWTGMGYRLRCLSGYAHGKETRFAAIWVKDGDKRPFEVRHDLTSQQYQATFEDLTKKGFRPIFLTGYPSGNSYRLAAVFVKDKGPEWAAWHDMTEGEYQKKFDDLVPRGFRPATIAAYPTPDGTRFAAVFVTGGGSAWSARHNMTAAEYQKEFDTRTKQGWPPEQVVGYPWDGGIRYAAVFARPVVVVKGPLPMTGTAVPELAAFDDAMQKFLQERAIPAGTLAVMKGGKIILSRGYGHTDDERTHLCGPDTVMRVASVSKPITLALLLQLIRDGKLKLDTKAFVYLGTQPPPGQKMDKRLLDITIRDLIDHKGGWDRDKAGDPMFKSLEIARALGKPGPATAQDIITYMAGQPLQHDPGKKEVYSNFGYCVLGRVIEKATGKTYIEALHERVTGPLGLKSIDLGRTLPKNRSPKEPTYFDPYFVTNVMDPKSKQQVPAPDGGFFLEAMDAHGGLIASAPDLVRFLHACWMDGRPRKAGESASYTFFGSLPGTWAMVKQREDGVNLAALFNQREDPSGLSYYDIEGMLDKAADRKK